MTVHTMCHNPLLPLDSVDPDLLLNFTSRECHMVPQVVEDGAMMVCGCQGEHECNDKLIFDKGADGEQKKLSLLNGGHEGGSMMMVMAVMSKVLLNRWID